MNPLSLAPSPRLLAEAKPSLFSGTCITAPAISDTFLTTSAAGNNRSIVLPLTLLKENGNSFISGLIHELRNPLTNIKLSVEFLESYTTDSKLKTFVDIINRSAIRMNDLINDLLRRNAKVQTEKHFIHQILDEVLELASDRIQLKNIKVIKEYNQDCELVMNKAEMKMALTNIIINAIDAMGPDNGELRLITKSFDGKDMLVIQDNGCGIGQENLKNIFKPYYTSKPGGLGLGLSATYDLLRLNNIGLNVKSEEHSGTQFNLLFERSVA